MNLNLRQLSLFLELTRCGSFSDAARARGISQPALSRTIQQLEAAIGQRLFDRTTRNVSLTPTGRALRPIAERLVSEFDGDLGELARFVQGRRGHIAVAALPSIAAVLLPPTIAAYQEETPDVEVSILDNLSGSVLDAVEEGRADIGLTIRPSPRSTLRYRSLLADEFGLVCRSDDELAIDAPVPWAVFASRPFVGMAPESSVRQMTDAAFMQAGLAVAARYGCGFLATTGSLIGAGLGISALPRLTMPLLGRTDLHWRRLERPTMRRQMGVVTSIGRAPTPAAQGFMAVLEREARKLR